MKIIQITDTHFSPTKSHFNNNWAPLLKWIDEQSADLVIHTGDLTVDGADHLEDITFCMSLMNMTRTPIRFVPGNHDVGHSAQSLQPVNAERLERWCCVVGYDRFVEDFADHSLIGINTLLCGFEDEREEAQYHWLEEVLAQRQNKHICLFSHKPLFVDDVTEDDTGYWGLNPRSRKRMLDILGKANVQLFASGHLHFAWNGQLDNINLTWGPSAAFILEELERPMPGERIVGAVIHHLGETVKTEFVQVPGMTAHILDEVIEEVYPQALSQIVEAAE